MTALFITIFSMSISATIVALAIMLIRIPMKKAPKIFSYALWGVVLFRLFCPFNIESNFSFMPALANAITQNIIYPQTPTVQSGMQIVDTSANAAINNMLPAVIQNGNESDLQNPVKQASRINTFYVVFEIAGYVWLSVFIVLLMYASIGYIRLKRRVYYATLIRSNIYETDAIKTPFVLGFIHPRIYIPINADLTQDEYILKHEQTHIKRLDYIIKPFAFIVFALHWFNPIMWLAYFLMSKDIEMSCDEAVLRKADDDIRSVYSLSLLNQSVKHSSLLAPLAFGESDVKERVKNVLNFKKPSQVIIILGIALVAVLSVGFAANRVSAKPDMPSHIAIDESYALDAATEQPRVDKYIAREDQQYYTDDSDDLLYHGTQTPMQLPPEPSETMSLQDVQRDTLLWPLQEYDHVNSMFGTRIHPVTKETIFHEGIDIPAPEGTPIMAASAGKVVNIGEDDNYGLFLTLDHGNSLQTFYAQMSGYVEGLEIGDTVQQGDVIGYVGDTGKATASYLLFCVIADGEYVNPIGYFTVIKE